MTSPEIHVLVAEDDPVFRRVIAFTLQRSGFAVTAVANGAEAWEFLQRQAVDCLVTDHQMPQMSGIELVQRIQDSPLQGRLPIVMCTAKSLEIDADFLMRHYELAAIMQKPFSPARLVTVLQEVNRAATLDPSTSGA